MDPTAIESDTFLRARLALSRGERHIEYLAPHSAFSSHRIDAGTLLLLDHLPEGEPGSFLDLGSGYGVLGLEAAARFPAARGLLVDRDLLAVEFSRRNASLQGALNVEVAASLGYSSLPPGWAPFDWILANVPARAGEGVLAMFLAGGAARLSPAGEMRIVAIEALAPSVERAARDLGIPWERVAATEKHAVYRFRPCGGPEPCDEDDSVYERDCVRLRLPEELCWVRPSDLADEPHRLPAAVPLLAGHLPEKPPGRVLVFRSGYGLLPALALARYPEARVVACDRDLLAAAFTRRNCRSYGDRVEVVECLGLREAARRGPFDLILGELSPPLGPWATIQEVAEAREALAPGGSALILGLRKQWRDCLKRASRDLGIAVRASRGAAALFDLSAQQRWPPAAGRRQR